MPQDTQMIKNYWRIGVKQKVRGIANLQERAAMRLKRIETLIYPRKVVLDNWQIRQARFTDIGKYELIDDWRTMRIGDTWGGKDYSAFFRRKVRMPAEFKGQKVVLRMYMGGDALLSINGVPYQGLDPFRDEVPITPNARGNEVYDLEVEAFVAWHWEEYGLHTLVASELATVDEEIRQAYWDFETALKVLEIPNLDQALRAHLQGITWELLKRVPLHDEEPASLRKQILEAAQELRGELYDAKLFKTEGLMHLVGHSHLDVVFMWPYREFIRKVGRTHSTMLRLMELYPDFKFSQSQAKLYYDMKKHFPTLFRQVKQRVKEGRWEPLGAFWVEPDCNLISGESFVRQIIYGQKFFQKEFGFKSRTCWQPDVFGCSWAMPQILAKSGIKYFLTNKMFIWNDTNAWKPNTFWWEGADGSRVLGIIPPGHFIGTVDPDHLHSQWANFSDKDTIGETLHIYGWGDGGGGVDPEMLESAVRYRNFTGLVKTRFSTAEEAFARILKKANNPAIPVYRDELYLEAHRGTYTNIGRFKKLNRQLEFLYRDAEVFASWAHLNGARYPSAKLDAGWQDLLTTQFHDSLPGTHIKEVYHELLKDYAGIEASGTTVRDAALSAVLGPKHAARSVRHAKAMAVVNTLPYERTDLMVLPAEDLRGKCLADGRGGTFVQQEVTDLAGTAKVLVKVPQVPSLGFACFGLQPKTARRKTAGSGVKATGNALENEFLRVRFDKTGEISSIWDKEFAREVLVSGQKANRFQLFEDTPGRYEAWDIVATYRDHEIDISGGARLSVDENGPIRASLILEKTCLSSGIRQRISLCTGSRLIRFDTCVDWKERQRLLKVGFPVEINARSATYDIAYGNIDRPNHSNTSYDAAKFEVCAHLWMDMSQSDYGVSLLNDCKYGHEAYGKLMRLSLLKGATFPNPEADIGVHHFTYVLYPHPGGWREAGTIELAQNLNNPLLGRLLTRELPEAAHSFVTLNTSKLTLEAIKLAEDGRDVIVRLVERHGSRINEARLTLDRPVKKAWACNLMEEKQTRLQVDGNSVCFEAKPCEIVTLRLGVESPGVNEGNGDTPALMP